MTEPDATPLQAVPAGAAAIATQAGRRDDRMPRGIPFIVANEFAERFCFYGINAILTVYMTRHLHWGDADATKWHSLFKAGAYFFPLVGAIVSDVFWGKYLTIMTFSLVYASGCAVLALVPGQAGMFLGLGMVAFGTGGIKPCVSTNVGDQFTSKNQHLIDKAFGYFYLAINAGSSFSIFFCPVLLQHFGPGVAFGTPAVMMVLATFVFWLGRKKFAVVPPAGRAFLDDLRKPENLLGILMLLVVYFFVACFWMLWDQSNGQTWTLQAESSLMDKDLGFGVVLLPAQIQVVNGLLILGMVPIFTFAIYPLVGRFFTVTPLRKIGVGLFTIAASFVIVARIEARIQAGQVVSAWWQILAYVVLTASEVLVSITALEFSYKQAPLRMKSFIMALFLVSTTVGNLMTAAVNQAIKRPLAVQAIDVGPRTHITLSEPPLVPGQKIDFGRGTGIDVTVDGKPQPLAGTYLVASADVAEGRYELMDVVNRKPVESSGVFRAGQDVEVTTYRLVGPEYFMFFAEVMAVVGLLFVFVATFYRERTFVREDEKTSTPA